MFQRRSRGWSHDLISRNTASGVAFHDIAIRELLQMRRMGTGARRAEGEEKIRLISDRMLLYVSLITKQNIYHRVET